MNDDIKLLAFICKNSEIQKNSLSKILPHIDNAKLKNILENQIDSYNSLSQLSKKQLKSFGEDKTFIDINKAIKDTNTDLNINLKLLANTKPTSIASLLLRSNTNEAIDITKKIMEYPGASGETRQLATNLLAQEEDYQRSLKKFL